MASRYGYQFTKHATDDLNGIVSYLSDELESPSAAEHFFNQLTAAIDAVRTFPEGAPLVANEYLPRSDVRKAQVGSYLMYYLPDQQAKTITILRIVYAKRNLEEILRELEL